MSVTIDRTRQRVVFGRELEVGSVLLEKCFNTACSNFGTRHDRGAEHELRIVRLERRGHHRLIRERGFWRSRVRREFEATSLAAVVVDEDGNEHPWTGNLDEPVRVRA